MGGGVDSGETLVVALSVGSSLAFGIALGVALGLALGIALGVALGVSFGVDSGIALGVVDIPKVGVGEATICSMVIAFIVPPDSSVPPLENPSGRSGRSDSTQASSSPSVSRRVYCDIRNSLVCGIDVHPLFLCHSSRIFRRTAESLTPWTISGGVVTFGSGPGFESLEEKTLFFDFIPFDPCFAAATP